MTVLAIAAAALSACSRRAGPAPLDDRSSMYFGRGTAVPIARPASERPPVSKAAALFTTPGSITVQPGDTLYALSKRNSVPIRAIINANAIAPPYVLRVGQKLTLPRQAYHQVTTGDSVASIARAYGVSSQELVRLNDIDPPYVIYVGQPILLPTTPGGQTVASNASVIAGTANQPIQPQAAPGAVSSQRLGTGSGASTVTSVSPNAPGGNAAQSGSPSFNPQAIQAAPTATAGAGAPSGQAQSQAQPAEVASLPSPAAPPPPEAPIAAPPVTASGSAFTWPVQGSVISGYGPKEGGLYNEGINIAVPQGTAVRAAQDGEVAYVGNELRGYGNLLLVRHPNGWVTAYAHNQQLLVQRGDKVKRGQVIARSGATGSVDSPQVHFELRQGTRSVDPSRYLGGQGVTDRGGVDLANGG
ncbi:MAG TPA: LysM peptidoglycan-binding domain-containing M23 family metallopeptidase [Alphaproteobacteria bacterium]